MVYMKSCIYLLTIGILVRSPLLRADEAPIVFARSGQQATLPVASQDTEGRSVALAAYEGIGAPVVVKNHAAEFTAPRVRVPSTFRLVSLRDGKVSLLPGELVVYPAPTYHEERPVQYVAAAAPDWFNTWSEAVGLPVRKFSTRESLGSAHWRMLEKPGLLILGPEKMDKSNLSGRPDGGLASDHFAPIFRLAAEYKINVLVLDTDWYAANETSGRETALSAEQMTGPLADLQTRNWQTPPRFRLRGVRILNRQAWIAGVEHPLVEEIRGRERGAQYSEDGVQLFALAETTRPERSGRRVVLPPTRRDRQRGRRSPASGRPLAPTLAGGERSQGGQASRVGGGAEIDRDRRGGERSERDRCLCARSPRQGRAPGGLL